MFGIDVSYAQGRIDWDKAKAAGVKFAIIRCGYGQDIERQDDDQFERNYAECKRLGIPVGTYLYSYAKSADRAEGEARHALRLLKGKSFELPIFYDLEEPGTEMVAKQNSETFCRILEDNGYEAGIYTSSYYFKTYIKDTTFCKWIAQWGRNDGSRGERPLHADIHQYSSVVTVDGISGGVDADYLYMTIETSPDCPLSEYTDEQLADMVLAGKFGNGEQRVQALGDRYGTVQSLVNARYEKKHKTYTVKRGDTLWGISRKFDTTIANLIEMNGIMDANLIYAGQVLKVE